MKEKKYILCARGSFDVNGGKASYDQGTPQDQTEAATELIFNRLFLIHLLQTKQITKQHIIVTLPERKFLYENIFDNVINYDPEINEYDYNIVDCNIFNKIKFKPFYQHYERDKEIIHKITYNKEILSEDIGDFLVCVPRLKVSDTRRNLSKEYWADFISSVKDKFDKIIVFGKGNENLDDGLRVKYVDTLQDYCSYIHHRNCKHVVSTISGPCHYVQQFGNSSNNTILTMIDNLGLTDSHGSSPCYFHPCINFTKVKINFIKNHLPTPENLSTTITQL
jgi:hypothetical protein